MTQDTNREPHETLIRKHAYSLWEDAGRPEGGAEEFWHQAERELADSLGNRSDGAATAGKKAGTTRRSSTTKTAGKANGKSPKKAAADKPASEQQSKSP